MSFFTKFVHGSRKYSAPFSATSHTRETLAAIAKEILRSIKKFCIFELMKTLTLNIPDNLEMDNKEVLLLVASKLYEQGKLSLGQAADVAGLTKRTFAEILSKYNVSIFNFPATDLSRDVANA